MTHKHTNLLPSPLAPATRAEKKQTEKKDRCQVVQIKHCDRNVRAEESPLVSAYHVFLEDRSLFFYPTLTRFVSGDNIKKIKCLRKKNPSPPHLRSNMLAYAWDLISTCSDLTKPLMTVKSSAFH